MILNKSVDFEIKTIQPDGFFSGYGSVFGVKDAYDDIVESGAFARSLQDYALKGAMPALLWQHKQDTPIGIWTAISEDAHGLKVEGRLLVDAVTKAKEAHALMTAKAVSGLSIGYRVRDYRIDSKNEVCRLLDVDLLEISIVTIPACDTARVDRVKQMIYQGKTPTERELELALRDLGLSHRQAKALIARGYDGIAQRDAAVALGNALDDFNNLIKGIV